MGLDAATQHSPLDLLNDDVAPVDERNLLSFAQVHRVVALDVHQIAVPHLLRPHRRVLKRRRLGEHCEYKMQPIAGMHL